MKRILLILILLPALQLYSQENFYNMVKNVEGIGYHLTDSLYNTTAASTPYRTDSKNNWINRMISAINKPGQDSLSLHRVDASKITAIKSFYIKSNKSILGNFHGRAEIQKWIFTSAAEAEKAKAMVDANKGYKTLLNKGAWSYWVHGQDLYFILTPGVYMKGHIKKIEAKIKEKQK